jgi:hypothetical protein
MTPSVTENQSDWGCDDLAGQDRCDGPPNEAQHREERVDAWDVARKDRDAQEAEPEGRHGDEEPAAVDGPRQQVRRREHEQTGDRHRNDEDQAVRLDHEAVRWLRSAEVADRVAKVL